MPSDPKTMTLENFQKQFIDLFKNQPLDDDFLSSIKAAGKLKNSYAALQIYQRGYICRLTEALGEIYEGLWSALGDEEFFRCCEEYIAVHPSISYNLNSYGYGFSVFLKSSTRPSFLSELARLDLAFFTTFHLPQHQHLEPQELVKIETNPNCIINFGESVSLLELKAPIYHMWKNRRKNRQELSEHPGGEYLVLYKQNHQVFVQSLEKQSFKLLAALKSGKSLDGYLEQNQLSPKDLSSLFHFIASAGLVTSLSCRF
jgi:hypothetical protein